MKPEIHLEGENAPMTKIEYLRNKFKGRSLDEKEVEYLLLKLEQTEKSLEKLSSGKFMAPMEYTQLEAHQKFAESILDNLREKAVKN